MEKRERKETARERERERERKLFSKYNKRDIKLMHKRSHILLKFYTKIAAN